MRLIRAANHSGAGNLPVKRIVIHATVSPCVRGQARRTAEYFTRSSTKASAHYAVDPGEAVRCLPDHLIGWHAPPNQHSIGVELCDPMAGSGSRWGDADHEAMLRRAAELVTNLCTQHDIPAQAVTPGQLRGGLRGVCGHDDVRDAWGQTTHWDPGPAFPWGRFIRMVRDDEEDVMIGLSKGDTGERVKGLQALIQYAGIELPRYGVDGDYGDETAEGLRQARESVGSRANDGYGDRVSGWAYAQLMKAVAKRQD